MRILLVNDDGFDEPGLRALENVLSDYDVVTVAPYYHHSGAGMSLNLYSPLLVRQHGEKRFSVEGTPVDCVKLALSEILASEPPDVVISGINPGANVANNIWYSGTVAAATEAAFWLIPAVALSQEYTSIPDFTASSQVALKLVKDGLFRMTEPGTILNVNVPSEHLGEYRLTSIGSFAREIPFSRQGDQQVFRYGPYEIQPVREESGTDVHALLDGHVSITRLSTSRHAPGGGDDLGAWCSRQL